MHSSLRNGGPLLLLFAATALNAVASEAAVSVPVRAGVSSAVGSVGKVVEPLAVQGLGPRVASVALAQLRGGTQVTENMTLDGTVSDNSADQVITGDNSINAGSFNGAVGVPMVIQNSGNNVLIQNATIINVQFQP